MLARTARRRRTQEERSAETRARLLDATVTCLSELGWARTTTTEIAERAGVSRGAQLHHFPTKAELVITAVEHLFERRNVEFRAAFARVPATSDRAAAAVDLLWSMVSGPTFHAWLELVVAARTDRALHRAVARVTRNFVDVTQRTFRELFPSPAAPNPLFALPFAEGEGEGRGAFELAPYFTFALMDGMALEQIVLPDPKRRNALLDVIKRLAAFAIPR